MVGVPVVSECPFRLTGTAFSCLLELGPKVAVG